MLEINADYCLDSSNQGWDMGFYAHGMLLAPASFGLHSIGVFPSAFNIQTHVTEIGYRLACNAAEWSIHSSFPRHLMQ